MLLTVYIIVYARAGEAAGPVALCAAVPLLLTEKCARKWRPSVGAPWWSETTVDSLSFECVQFLGGQVAVSKPSPLPKGGLSGTLCLLLLEFSSSLHLFYFLHICFLFWTNLGLWDVAKTGQRISRMRPQWWHLLWLKYIKTEELMAVHDNSATALTRSVFDIFFFCPKFMCVGFYTV